MDAERFDVILRSLSTAPARRHVLRALAGSTLGLLAVEARPVVARKKRKRRRNKRRSQPPCIPSCANTDCGPDGCGGICGACTGGTCRDGTCDCSAGGKELCGDTCVDPCDATTERRNPFTCTCCKANGEAATCVDNQSAECCSGSCIGNTTCAGFGVGSPCAFNAQCKGENCQVNGTCALG